jgi:hypothetical protein
MPTALPFTTTLAPVAAPTMLPVTTTSTPTVANCGISEQERVLAILAILDAIADPNLIRDINTPQGLATTWIIQDDEWRGCPDDPKIIQRWTMAVFYFSTNGDDWTKCSANTNAVDLCGSEEPFIAKKRFLSPVQECAWAGVSCIDGSVTEVEYEDNNLAGTIPTEMGLLSMLTVWGMERGGLTGPIPTEIGKLSSLVFIDFDFNQLTGSLPSELFTLRNLTQLDINSNKFTGSIDGIGSFPLMEFMQLHDNFFTGTVPDAVGTYDKMVAFTLHKTGITGTMPAGMCDLLVVNGGVLDSLIADCAGVDPDIVCTCCTDCRKEVV